MADIKSLSRIVTIVYVSIQVVVALFVSVIGAIHVRQSMQSKTSNTTEQKAQNDAEKTTADDAGIEITTDDHDTEHKASKGFWKLWARTVWKMRSVYSSLAVHSFDVLTDVLVILQWINAENIPDDNVDPQAMAYSGIAVIVFSRVISAIAIFIKDRDFVRSVLQLFDLLIFQEIYESHHKIVSQFKNKQIRNKRQAVDSTLSFKYVRNMEAVFESIPESVLQLVYVMRIGFHNFGTESTDQPIGIFVVSIIQSVISMTNSILNNDNTLMKEDKWAKYKQRFPPTFEFCKHALCRISEIIYRIGLFALFWTVCEGLAFSILIGIELLFIVMRVTFFIYVEESVFDADTILLAINTLIVVSSEEMYGIAVFPWHFMFGCLLCADDNDDSVSLRIVYVCFLLIVNIFCCMGPAVFLASIWSLCDADEDVAFPPIVRIGTSLNEIIFIIIWALVYEEDDELTRQTFLMDPEHGLVIFIVTCICLVVYTQYRVLFPDFSLPMNVNVRSKWGYAYSNELNELQKMKVPLKRMPYEIERKSRQKNESQRKTVKFKIASEGDFWDEPYTLYGNDQHITAAMFAWAKGNYSIVEWLESRGADKHKHVDLEKVSDLIHPSED
eukprot:239316_1